MPDPIAILVPQEIANDDAVRIVSLNIKESQWVNEGDHVAVIETSKSTIEVTATGNGWAELCTKAGEDMPIGGTIAKLHAMQKSLTAPKVPAPGDTITADSPTWQPVFSNAAQRKIESLGLEPVDFQGSRFVRERDITNASSLPSAASPPTDGELVTSQTSDPVTSQPLQQSFCEDWPWHQLLKADLYRINGRVNAGELFTQWQKNPWFVYVLWFRIAQAARHSLLARLFIYPFAVWRMNRCHYRTGIRIPLSVKAGPGLFVGHWGSVVVNPGCSFGANCSLGNDINIGGAGDAGTKGVPQFGDNVFIGPGARLSGPIIVAQEAAVMANTLVAADLPPGAIAIGVPHRISGFQTINRFVSNRCQFLPPSAIT